MTEAKMTDPTTESKQTGKAGRDWPATASNREIEEVLAILRTFSPLSLVRLAGEELPIHLVKACNTRTALNSLPFYRFKICGSI